MTGITEACFCGHVGDLALREPTGTAILPALRCPRCAHVDDLGWLPLEHRRKVWEAARERVEVLDPARAA